MVQILMQGMRRSGTTIFYDALAQDPTITPWYEPLARTDKPAIGGGSGAQAVDHFSSLRQVKREFTSTAGLRPDYDFNFGAPAHPEQEFEATFSEPVANYLRHILEQPSFAMAKFTRVYCKARALSELAPEARFVHLVRDPKAVVASYLFGKNARNKHLYPDAHTYFSRTTTYSAWSSHRFSEIILRIPGYELRSEPTDLERILAVWRYTFEQTRRQGLAAFGDKYALVRHEDLCRSPIEVLEGIYSLVDRAMPSEVSIWASENVRRGLEPHESDSPRWPQAFELLNLGPSLETAGY